MSQAPRLELDEAGSAVVAVVDTYPDLARALAARRHELGLSQLATDHIAGLQDGYTGKIECGTKHLGEVSMPCLLGALGLKLVVVRAVPHAEKQGRDVGDQYHPQSQSGEGRMKRWDRQP